MTNDEMIAWLRRYRQALNEERRLRQAVADAQSRAEATSRALGTVAVQGRGPERDPMAACIELLEERRLQLVRQVRESECLRAQIEAALARVPDALQRQVLMLKYIDGAPWWKIADSLYISERWAQVLHRKGVAYLASVRTGSPLCL